MKMTYEEALLNPAVPFNTIIENLAIPSHLYKYQSFYSKEGKENAYWRENLRGSFHLSLGSEFEDYNDCRPYMDKKEVAERIETFLKNKIEDEQLDRLIKVTNEELSEEYFNDVMSNFRNNIRIGCFTTSCENSTMWKKYSNNNTGYCLEYKTDNHVLFNYSTLPVLYSTKPYNSSLSLANQIILEAVKDDNLEEHIKKYSTIYAKQLKIAYIPIFIKEKMRWEFEDEYRMFLLANRQTKIGMLKSGEILDSNYNLDLSKAISAIYLGENFCENINADHIKKNIIDIAKVLNIKVFQKRIVDKKIINDVIV